MVVLFAALPALILGAISWAAGGVVAGLVVLAVVAVVAAIWARFGGERRVLAAIRARTPTRPSTPAWSTWSKA